MSGNKLFLSPKTSNLTNFHPPISLANLNVLRASFELKQPAVLGKYVIFLGSIKSINRGFFVSNILTLLTATVTISAPEILIAFAHSLMELYLPVPTINLDEKVFFAIFNLSIFSLPSTNKLYYFNFVRWFYYNLV